MDTNSAFFAKYCFSLGINLKRVEVIGDDEGEIAEAVGRMSSNYDFVVTRYIYYPELDPLEESADHMLQRRDRPNVSMRGYHA